MPSEFDPRNIWQNQPTEPFKMSPDLLHHKSQQRYERARLEAMSSIGLGLILSVLFLLMFIRSENGISRYGSGLLSLWCLYFAYQGYRWVWPERLEPDATVSASMEFYRKELEKRRDYARHIWRRTGLTFCFLGLAMLVVPLLMKAVETPSQLVNAVPFFVLLAAWAVIFLSTQRRNRQKLQQEIEELQAFERGNKT